MNICIHDLTSTKSLQKFCIPNCFASSICLFNLLLTFSFSASARLYLSYITSTTKLALQCDSEVCYMKFVVMGDADYKNHNSSIQKFYLGIVSYGLLFTMKQLKNKHPKSQKMHIHIEYYINNTQLINIVKIFYLRQRLQNLLIIRYDRF